MAIITYEGFENYSSFDAVKSFLNYSNVGAMSFINATDANGVTPRNGGSCIKFTNTTSTYPRFLIKSPNNATNTSGVFGFAWYPILPAGGGWGSATPIATIVDSVGRPHFYVTINSNLNIVLRALDTAYAARHAQCWANGRYNHTNMRWSDLTFDWDCGKGGCQQSWYLTEGCSEYGGQANHLISTNSLPILGSSSSLVTMNAWNYIEVKYSLSATASGYVQLKLNRNANDATLDINAQNVRTSYQVSPSAQGLVFGIHWSSNAANTATLHSGSWTSYFDDIYWADLTGSNNDFLGRVSCKKFSYNEAASYNMTTPSSSVTALSNINETYSGAGTVSTRNLGNVVGQTLDVRSTGVSSETLSPVFVRQYVHGYKTETNSDIAVGATNGANNIAVSGVGVSADSVNGSLRYRDYDNAPDGAEWTNQKIAETVFKHTVIAT